MLTTRRILPIVYGASRSPIARPRSINFNHPTVINISLRTMAAMTPIFTKEAAPVQGPYSQAIKTPNAIYCSGQIPCDKDGNLIDGTMREKTAMCIKNLEAVLTEAGSSIEKVVKVNVFLTDMSNFAHMNEEYQEWFAHKPARSCVAVKQLPKGVDVEIECIALP